MAPRLPAGEASLSHLRSGSITDLSAASAGCGVPVVGTEYAKGPDRLPGWTNRLAGRAPTRQRVRSGADPAARGWPCGPAAAGPLLQAASSCRPPAGPAEETRQEAHAPSPQGARARAAPAQHDLHPPLRGEGRGALHAREDPGLSPPLRDDGGAPPASSRTARWTRGSSTSRSTSRLCGNCRSSSSARTPSTPGRGRPAAIETEVAEAEVTVGIDQAVQAAERGLRDPGEDLTRDVHTRGPSWRRRSIRVASGPGGFSPATPCARPSGRPASARARSRPRPRPGGHRPSPGAQGR